MRPLSSHATAFAVAALLVQIAGCTRHNSATKSQPVRIAAASDLTVAFEALGALFETRHGQSVTFSFGSTGLLAKQITEGAPFDLFAAANVSFLDGVIASGACDRTTVAPYARGRIVLWSKRGSTKRPTSLADLEDPSFARVALANPEHAPYGQAGREALQTLGLWEKLSPRLVFGENVRQALQFGESGNVEAAIVALSLVALDDVNHWTLIDEQQHRPIDQALILCRGGSNRAGAEAFVTLLRSEEGRALMTRHGFLLPGEGTRSEQ
jgi:molybdate transport system substrate-binding protein